MYRWFLEGQPGTEYESMQALGVGLAQAAWQPKKRNGRRPDAGLRDREVTWVGT
jgi:hypothetical protein